MKTADRVRETTLSGGVGAITLGGAQIGFRTFAAAFADNDGVWYAIDDAAGNWEVGRGTYAAGVITRNTVLASSNANALVNFGAGNVKSVFATIPGEYLQNVTGNLVFSANNQFDIGDAAGTGKPRTGYFGTSVATPLLQTLSGPLQFSSATGVVSTNSDNTTTLGDVTHRWISVISTIFDSGSGTLALKGAGTLAQTITGANTVLAGTLDVQDLIHATTRFPNIGTTANVANATLNAVGSNDLLRSTSSRKFKAHIQDLRKGEEDAVLELRPRWFTSKSFYDDPTLWHLSFVAEEAAEVHPAFVIRNRQSGEPENINDRAILALAIAKIQQLERRLAARKL